MKIAAVVDSKGKLRPLDQGENIVIIDDGGRRVVKNPGFGLEHGGKERAMRLIINEGADAVIANHRFLCPCSYEMSYGRLKYAITKADTLDNLINSISELEIKDELEPEMYKEEGHHAEKQLKIRRVNANFE